VWRAGRARGRRSFCPRGPSPRRNRTHKLFRRSRGGPGGPTKQRSPASSSPASRRTPGGGARRVVLALTTRPSFGSFGCSVNLPLGSRSADPHSTAVGVEACSTPVLNRAQWGCWPHNSLDRVLATATKICAGRRSGRGWPRYPHGGRPCPFYTAMLCSSRPACVCPHTPQRRQIVGGSTLCAGLGTIHFRSCTLRQVSCYTFLSGFQPSWPPSCYPEQATSFVGSEYEPALGFCRSTLGAPRIASTAYQ